MAGNDVDAASATRVLGSEQAFTSALDAMLSELSGDPDAAELTAAYEEAIRAQLDGLDGLRLERMACGLRVCLATFEEEQPASWDAWHARFDADPATPASVFIEREVESGNGTRQRRIIYSTDPTSSGIRAPLSGGG